MLEAVVKESVGEVPPLAERDTFYGRFCKNNINTSAVRDTVIYRRLVKYCRSLGERLPI
jgi:hypothetical protein